MRVYVITLGFVPSRIWEKSLDQFYKLKNPDIKIEHLFVDQHYPLNEDINRRDLWEINCSYGITTLDPQKNLGLHEGFNYALKRIPLQREDIVVGYDPDSFPISEGFLGAMVHPFALDPFIGWVSLMNERAKPELIDRGYTLKKKGHLNLWYTHKPVVNSICAWRASFLLDVGGLHEPNPWYGHLETEMWDRLKSKKLEWAFTQDWWEDDRLRNLQDEEYKNWKWYFSHCKYIDYDFKTYIKNGCPIFREKPTPKKIP